MANSERTTLNSSCTNRAQPTSNRKRAHVSIRGGPEPWRYDVEMDGEKVPYLRRLSFRADSQSFPTLELDVLGSVEFDGTADVEIISELGKALREVERLQGIEEVNLVEQGFADRLSRLERLREAVEARERAPMWVPFDTPEDRAKWYAECTGYMTTERDIDDALDALNKEGSSAK